MTRRPRHLLVLAATVVAAAVLTRAVFRSQPGSGRQALLTFAFAAVLLGGSYVSGGWPVMHRRGRRPVVGPLLTALVLFAAFSLFALVAAWLLPFGDDVDEVLRHVRSGDTVAVALGAVAAGVAEEVLYRGALFERLRLPVVTTTLAHMAATLLVANVALTLAAAALGVVLATSRRVSGGWWAPAVTHAVWTLLFLWQPS